MITSWSPGGRGGTTSSLWPLRISSGSRAMKASSSDRVPVRAGSSAGVPVPTTLPANIATRWSNRAASSM